jgi:hypothetical protein
MFCSGLIQIDRVRANPSHPEHFAYHLPVLRGCPGRTAMDRIMLKWERQGRGASVALVCFDDITDSFPWTASFHI